MKGLDVNAGNERTELYYEAKPQRQDDPLFSVVRIFGSIEMSIYSHMYAYLHYQ